MSNWTVQLVPSYVTTVTGLSSDTSSGHAVLNGGGGLHVAFGWHSTLIAAMQPSLILNSVQRASFDGGGVGCCAGGGVCCAGGGGFAITTGGGCGGCAGGWFVAGGGWFI